MADDDFAGTARFEIRRRLGAGGMGIVYEAWDRERGAVVALKTLRGLDAGAIYRLKREFRTQIDLAHPNLVSLHELFSEQGRWFFTMELVEGIDFLSWVRPGWRREEVNDVTAPLEPRAAAAEASTVRAATAGPGALDEARLRAALRELAGAVAALHEASQMHRDLKPGNVLVEPGGRVVVLDFGLTTDLRRGHGDRSTEQVIAGTPLYMAPEQAAGEAAGPPADWYALGVMLYQALTGRPPFTGSQLQILMDKQSREPPAPRLLAPDAPEDLSALCTLLLRREPASRPSTADLLHLLGATPKPGQSLSSTDGNIGLVGQERVLALLREAFGQARRGRASCVLLHGSPGVGTSSVAKAFAEEARRDADAVVLSGRCHERESVPYKALDSVIDGLSHFLRTLPRLEVEALLPRDARALARMFPVLQRVEAIAAAPRLGPETPDPQELRKRATTALRELLGRIADRRPLVLWVDGLQWGDPDSGALIAELMRPPDAPALLLLGCHRSPATGEAAGSRGGLSSASEEDLPATLAQLRALLSQVCPVEELEVTPLGEPDALALAALLLHRAGLPGEHARAVARESRGNPFFAHELVRVLQVANPRRTIDGVKLEEAIALRLEQLPEPARRLLEAAAVSGAPSTPTVLARAADLQGDARQLFSLLRAAHLLRSNGEGERLEPYHDRIRETVTQALSEGRRRELHGRLAVALEAVARPEDEAALAWHYQAAGQPDRAAHWAAQAGDRAAQALAFQRASRLYRLALDLRAPDGQQRTDLEARLADALANAGLGAEAARTYLTAAARPWVTRAMGIELRRRAADQYLRSGLVDDGLGVLRDVLANFGMGVATSPQRAFASLLYRRARVWLRGMRFEPRDESQVSAEELAKVDVCWTGAVGLGMVDIIRGSNFQAQHLLLALEAGEPMRVARALTAEAPFVATPGGPRAQREALALVARGRELALELNNPHVEALASLMGAIVDFLAGRWRRALEQADEATALFRARCTGVAWEVSNSQLFSLWSLFYLGELGELRRRVDALLHEARARGDLYAVTSFRTGLTGAAFLVGDDVAGARREVAEVLDQWSHQGFHFQHYYCLLAQGIIDLYAGDGAPTFARMEQQWPLLRRSLLLRIENVNIEATHLRARACLAALDGTAADAGRLREVGLQARWLLRSGSAWARALGAMLEAGVLAAEGSVDPAITRFEQAAAQLEALEMKLFTVAARRRAGELRGGAEGDKAIHESNELMRTQGIANPSRMADLLAPRAQKLH